jgi:hypothetical protein
MLRAFIQGKSLVMIAIPRELKPEWFSPAIHETEGGKLRL